MVSEAEKPEGFLPSQELAAKIEREFLKTHRLPFGRALASPDPDSEVSRVLDYLSQRQWLAKMFNGAFCIIHIRFGYSVPVGETAEMDLMGSDGFAPQFMKRLRCTFFHPCPLGCDKTLPNKKQGDLLRALADEFKRWLQLPNSCDCYSFNRCSLSGQILDAIALKVKDNRVILEIKKINDYPNKGNRKPLTRLE